MLRAMPRTLFRLCFAKLGLYLLCFVDAFSCDMLGYKRKHLDVGPEVFDFAFNVLLVGREAPGEAAADLKCLLLVIDEFDSPEDDDAPERVRPAAIVLHAIVDDGERCP